MTRYYYVLFQYHLKTIIIFVINILNSIFFFHFNFSQSFSN